MSKTNCKFRCRPPVDGFAREGDGLHEPIDDRTEFMPSTSPPGSDAKIDLMGDRYASGLPVFHPEDLQIDQDDRYVASSNEFLEPEDD